MPTSSPASSSLPDLSRTIEAASTALTTHEADMLAPLRSGKKSIALRLRECADDRQFYHATIASAIQQLDTVLNNARPLSQAVINIIADDIIDQYGRFLRLADIPAIMKLARRGYFGTAFYGGLSEPAIMEMVDKFIDERTSLLERCHDREDSQRNAPVQYYEEAVEVEDVEQADGTTTKVGHIVLRLTEQAKRRQEEWATVAKSSSISEEPTPAPQPSPSFLSDEELRTEADRQRRELRAAYSDYFQDPTVVTE